MPPRSTNPTAVHAPQPQPPTALLSGMTTEQLFHFRAALEVEMRKRKLAFSVGEYGEHLAIEHFRCTPGLPKLQPAPRGTKNIDALSRNGDRYSIKTICNAKKTGTIYPDPQDKTKQLFEYLLIVTMNDDWSLKSIHQLPWAIFVEIRSWDKRMNAWYVSCSVSNLKLSHQIHPHLEHRTSTNEIAPAPVENI